MCGVKREQNLHLYLPFFPPTFIGQVMPCAPHTATLYPTQVHTTTRKGIKRTNQLACSTSCQNSTAKKKNATEYQHPDNLTELGMVDVAEIMAQDPGFKKL